MRIYNFAAIVLISVLAFVTQGLSHDEGAPVRELVYQISCASTADECVGVVGNVSSAVHDTSQLCQVESAIRCNQRYGKYGLALREKTAVSTLDASGDLVYQLQSEGNKVQSPSLSVVGDDLYLLWVETLYRIKDEGLSRVMYTWRPMGGGMNDWSTPNVLFTNRNNTAQSYETAIQPETSGANGAALHVVLDVVAEEGGPEVLYALLRKGSVVTTSKVDIPYIGYPQIEVVGDSLYIAYMGTIGRHMPGLANVRPRTKPDGNNVFFSSRHVDEEKWTASQLVADTEEADAHYLKTTSFKDVLQIGFVEQHPDSSQEYYRQHTIRVGDAPVRLDTLTYGLTGNIQRQNSFQMISGYPGVLVLQWEGRTTEFHLLRSADTNPQILRTELPEMSGTYYMNGETPQVSYIAIKQHRSPVEMEIRTVRFDP